MRFRAEREVMAAALSFVAKYANQKDAIPILATIKIEAADGRVRVTATDLEQAASDSFAADVEREGSLCLPAALVSKAVTSSGASEVVIDADDKQAVVVIGGRSRLTIPVLPVGDFPDMTMLAAEGEASFSLPGATLAVIEGRVSFAQTKDKTRFYLAGTYWEISGKSLSLAATDGHVLSHWNVDAPEGSAEMPAIIAPPFAVPGWDDDVAVTASKNFIRFNHGDQVVASKLVDGSFPDFRRIIPQNETSLRFDREELMAGIKRMALVADLKQHSVLFVGRDGKVTLSSRSSRGEISEEIAYDGDDFQTAIIHSVSLPALASFDCETIEWRWGDHTTPVTVHDPKDDSRLVVMVPYRDTRLVEFIPEFKQAAE